MAWNSRLNENERYSAKITLLKKSGAAMRLKTVMTVLIPSLLFIVPGTAMALESGNWKDLPQLVFNRCVDFTTHVRPNIFSPLANDFLVVSAYEEYPEEAAKTIDFDRRFLNVYLINGILMAQGGHVGIVYNTHLVVDRGTFDVETDTKTIYQWVLSDMDRDGSVDSAKFQTIVKSSEDNVLTAEEVEIPDDDLMEVQTFYNDAVHMMDQKTEEKGKSRTCIPV
jgi:hypothetical protein